MDSTFATMAAGVSASSCGWKLEIQNGSGSFLSFDCSANVQEFVASFFPVAVRTANDVAVMATRCRKPPRKLPASRARIKELQDSKSIPFRMCWDRA